MHGCVEAAHSCAALEQRDGDLGFGEHVTQEPFCVGAKRPFACAPNACVDSGALMQNQTVLNERHTSGMCKGPISTVCVAIVTLVTPRALSYQVGR